MQLSDIRTEVYAKGFGTTRFPVSRVNNFINDGYLMICRRVQYYTQEASYSINTANGTTNYALPAGWGRIRDLWDTVRNVAIIPTSLRMIDNSGVPSNGPPQYYAMDGANIHLWPTPDAIYNLSLRYWSLPSLLVNDTDVPTLPPDYHKLLWLYGTWQCYESDDDPTMGQFWQTRFTTELNMFAADVKFPDTEGNDMAESMWDSDRGLNPSGQWSLWGWV